MTPPITEMRERESRVSIVRLPRSSSTTTNAIVIPIKRFRAMEPPGSVCCGYTRQDDDAAGDPSMVGFAMGGMVLMMMMVRMGMMDLFGSSDARGIAV